MIEAAQIKAARALLGISQLALSELADVGINTVKRIELTDEITGSARTLWKIQTALEQAGVGFDSSGRAQRARRSIKGKDWEQGEAEAHSC